MNPLDPQSDALDPDLELAHAYLEGEVDDRERMRVESSPALVELVSTLRSACAAVAAPVPVPEAARTSAMAAAKAAFDAAAAESGQAARPASRPPVGTTDHPVGATVQSISTRRQRQYRWFGGAAAAAAVIALVVSVGPFGADDRDADMKSAERSSASMPASTAAAGAAQEATTAADDAQPGDTSLTMAEAPAAAAPTARDVDAGATTAAAGPIAIDAPEQLLELSAPPPPGAGAVTTTARASASVPDLDIGAASVACVAPGQIFLASITYRGAPAVAVNDPALGVRQALDATTCAVLAEISEAA